MGFKYYFNNSLLVEASILFEGDEEIEAIVSKLKDPSTPPEEKQQLQQQLQQLIRQKKSGKGKTDKQSPINKFAQSKGLSPDEVQHVLKQTDPTGKYHQVIMNWWKKGEFEPKDSMLLNQNLTSYEEYKDKIGPITKFGSPKKLETTLDQIQHQKSSYQQDLDINDPPVYEDEQVKVFHGSDRNRCIKYGKGTQHTLCVARPDHSNLYLGYRSRGATFYFIYFKNEEAEHGQLKEGVDFIVIHVYPYKMQINHVEPNSDVDITEEELLNKFPSLKGFMSSGQMQHKEHTEHEKEQFKVKNYRNILEAENYKEAETYIEIGKQVDDNSWEELEKRGYDIKPLVAKYVETGVGDIPWDLIDRFNLRKRYEEILKRRFNVKKDNLNNVTAHEYGIIDTLENKDDIIQGIASRPSHALEYANAKGYENVDSEIIQGIASRPSHALEYANAKGYENVDSEIIQGIASHPSTAFQYANAKGYENVDSEIIQGIASHPSTASQYAKAKGLDDLDPETKQKFIQSIASDPNTALEYAKAKGLDDLDPETKQKFIHRISSESYYALEYAKAKGFENLDPETKQKFIHRISSESYYALEYAKAKGLDDLDPETKQKFIQSIASNPNYALEYAKAKGFENLDPETKQKFIQRIASNPSYALEYAKAKGYENLDPVQDKPIIDALKKAGKL